MVQPKAEQPDRFRWPCACTQVVQLKGFLFIRPGHKLMYNSSVLDLTGIPITLFSDAVS